MTGTELKQSVSEYRRLWEEAGLELSPRWRRLFAAVQRGTRPSAALAAEPSAAGAIVVEGNPQASLVFVGEGASTEAFPGPAGALLNKIIEAMGLDRQKDTCLLGLGPWPTGNVLEADAPLQKQLEGVRPRVVVALGELAARVLVDKPGDPALHRGRFFPLKWNPQVSVRVTFHPSHLLSHPGAKKDVWEDMKRVLETLGGIKR